MTHRNGVSHIAAQIQVMPGYHATNLITSSESGQRIAFYEAAHKVIAER